jgi:hypothetical protein
MVGGHGEIAFLGHTAKAPGLDESDIRKQDRTSSAGLIGRMLQRRLAILQIETARLGAMMPTGESDQLTVGLAQIAPVWLERMATLSKVVD